MKTIRKGDLSYQILTSAEVERVEVPIIDDIYVIYKCKGSVYDRDENHRVVTMLFLKKDSADILQSHLENEYGDIAKICDLPPDYSDDKFNQRYMNDRVDSKDFILYVIIPNEQFESEEKKAKQTGDAEAINESADTEKNGGNEKPPRLGSNIHKIILVTGGFLLTIIVICAIIKDRYRTSDDGETSTEVNSIVETTSEQPMSIVGDLNTDGKVTDDDFQLLLDYINNPDTLPDELFDVADISQDGFFDTRDLTEFKRKFQ